MSIGRLFLRQNVYNGYTTRLYRFSLHLNDSISIPIPKHLKQKHNFPHSNICKILDDDTTTLTYCNYLNKLKILEAILIKSKHSKIDRIKFEFYTNILKCI